MAVAERHPDTASSAQRLELRMALSQTLEGPRPDTITRLVETARLWTAKPGDVIYRQGERVPLTFVLRGHGIAQRTTDSGQQILSGVVVPDTLFGYSGIASIQSTVEILALTECLVAQWPGSEIRALVAADPAFALIALDSIAGSLHALMEQIEGFLHQDARRRVLRILARHRALFFGDPPVLNRTHLPGLVGTSREMTGRVLRQLERDGVIRRYGRSGLTLLRPDRLEAAAN